MTPADTGADDLIVAALLSGASYAVAADAAGVSKSTVQRRMREPEFRIRLTAERSETLRRVRDQLGLAAADAVPLLAALMNDPGESGAVRTRAARSLLDLAQRFAEELPLPEPPELGQPCPTCSHTEPTPEQRKKAMDDFQAELNLARERMKAADALPHASEGRGR